MLRCELRTQRWFHLSRRLPPGFLLELQESNSNGLGSLSQPKCSKEVTVLHGELRRPYPNLGQIRMQRITSAVKTSAGIYAKCFTVTQACVSECALCRGMYRLYTNIQSTGVREEACP
eukprot:Blabericola_migrator_1__12302@NODE_769_length_6592_cov_104_272490_g547_i0_p4_GENE_NODE_769_length_6592_cov_104_272490_g547_i0NODE_769_length_6592_cov_104_272490_g547_i0_p4_ORF_typecomplete_len118_score9_13_NODE_769_length_6592_cov_104_272490_g547_i028223175